MNLKRAFFSLILRKFTPFLMGILFSCYLIPGLTLATTTKTVLLPNVAHLLESQIKTSKTTPDIFEKFYAGHKEVIDFSNSNVGKVSSKIDRFAAESMRDKKFKEPTLPWIKSKKNKENYRKKKEHYQSVQSLDTDLRELNSRVIHAILTQDGFESVRARIQQKVAQALPEGSDSKLMLHIQTLQADNGIERRWYRRATVGNMNQHALIALTKKEKTVSTA